MNLNYMLPTYLFSSMDALFWHFNIHLQHGHRSFLAFQIYLKFHGAVSALEEYRNYDSKKDHEEDTSKSSFSSSGVPSSGRVLCRGV